MADKRLMVPKNPAMALRALNARHAAAAPEEETEETTEENTTILQTDKQTHQLTNTPTDKQSNKGTDKPTNKPTRSGNVTRPKAPESVPQEDSRPVRVDGRTLRPRQETADRTMVTSMRLSVVIVERLDEFCWRHRKRKQDVLQEALEMYFAAEETGD